MKSSEQIQLRSMTQEEFDFYLDQAIRSYAEEMAIAAYWSHEEALQRSKETHASLLPDGLKTADHYLFSIVRSTKSSPIGILWLAINRKSSPPSGFIYDISIDEPYRGLGYGRQAMLALEVEAAKLGVGSIGLHVFEHNARAKALYLSLGYQVKSMNMSKVLSQPVEQEPVTNKELNTMDTNKEQILNSLSLIFAHWQKLISRLDEAQILAPMAPSDWTVKDVIAHCYIWQQASVARAEAALSGNQPAYPEWWVINGPNPEEDLDRTNSWIYEHTRDRPWNTVYADWEDQFKRYLELTRQVPEESLLQPGKYAWMGSYRLIDSALGSCGHHEEHYETLCNWLREHGSLPAGIE